MKNSDIKNNLFIYDNTVWMRGSKKSPLNGGFMVKYCGFDCEYAEPCDDVPGCLTYNPIQCKLKNKIVSKGMICDSLEDI